MFGIGPLQIADRPRSDDDVFERGLPRIEGKTTRGHVPAKHIGLQFLDAHILQSINGKLCRSVGKFDAAHLRPAETQSLPGVRPGRPGARERQSSRQAFDYGSRISPTEGPFAQTQFAIG